MANSADGIMLTAKKSSAHILSHFWEVFLIALYYGLCTCSIVIKKAKTPLYIWKKYIILSKYIILNENICIKLFITIKEDFDT